MLAIAGAVGTLARYGVGQLAQRIFNDSFPWGTAIINISGCLLFGLVFVMAENRKMIGTDARLVILTGFMGAYTTFSTFAFETAQMFSESQWATRGAINLIVQNGLGIAAVFAGLAIGRYF